MPSISSGLFAARAGIDSHGTAISVLADNISNANTVAFKASRSEFTDLIAGSLGGGASGLSVGSGSSIAGITEVFTQGTLEFTGRGLDNAIDGNGFFVLQDSTGARFYSRAGNFKVDAEGNLRNQNDLYVLGFSSTGTGGLSTLNVRDINQSDIETQNVTISGNLDASATLTSVPAGTPTFTQLGNAASFQTSIQVFDTLGASHFITMYYFHTASGVWQARAYVDEGDVTPANAGNALLVGSVTLNFNSSGFRTPPPVSGTPDFTINPGANWANGATGSAINTFLAPYTQFSTPSNVASNSQDGKSAGNVVSFSIESDGTLFARLDNGQDSEIGTVALATFSNTEGLNRAGGSLYVNTLESGAPVVGTPSVGQFGAIQSGALELSSADIGADFIKLISYQRGFQGSSRIVTSIDQLLDEVINLAR